MMNENMTPQSPENSAEPRIQQDAAGQSTGQVNPAPQQAVSQAKPRKRGMNPVLKLLLWLVVILAVVALGLVISAYIAGFNTVFEMIDWIIAQF